MSFSFSGSGRALTGPERGHESVGEQQDTALYSVHTTRYRQFP